MSELALAAVKIEPGEFAIEAPSQTPKQTSRAAISVLALSPFSPFPQDAGQRKRVHQTLAVLKELGLSITLLLYPFEGEWAWRYQEDVMERLRSEYDEIIVLPAPKTIGARPQYGQLHGLDEWWDELLGAYLTRLFEVRHFDVLLVNNVWLSKALTLVPPRVCRVIDMHDLFHLREKAYATAGVTPEFFRISEKDELFGLNRADACVAISLPEARHLAETIQPSRLVYLPYGAPPMDRAPATRQYLHPEKVVFGFIGTSHTFNISGVSALLEELCTVVSQNFAPIELVFAGTICDKLDSFAERIHMNRLGWVEDEELFYDSIDFYIVPVFHGSGFKIKVADILERRKPALFSEHAIAGLSVDRALVVDSPAALARVMSEIAFTRPPLEAYRDMIEKGRQALNGQLATGVNTLVSCLARCLVECVLDLRGLTGSRGLLTLLSAATLARELKDHARVRIISDLAPSSIEAVARHLPPAVSIESDWTSWQLPGKPVNTLWWRFGTHAEAAPPCRHMITDVRFVDGFATAALSGDVIASPDQGAALQGVAYSCLPYLTESICWDPGARAILAACAKWRAERSAEERPMTAHGTVVMVDSDIDLRSTIELLGKLGIHAETVDLRNDDELTGLVESLYQVMGGHDHPLRLLDGCIGTSPFRWLILEMAVLVGVPFSAAILGGARAADNAELAEWRTRKAAEDRLALQPVIQKMDAMRGALHRL